MRINKIKNKKGFTLMELLMATFIFSVVMIAVSGAFISSINNYNETIATQKNLEDAQFQINLMAKVIRTSNVIGCLKPGSGLPSCNEDGQCFVEDCSSISPSSDLIGIRVYDYSQNKCIEYSFVDYNESKDELVKREEDISEDLCKVNTFEIHSDFSSWNVNSFRWRVVQSKKNDGINEGVAGKVLLSAEICLDTDETGDNCSAQTKDKTRIQTTVSLRNY